MVHGFKFRAQVPKSGVTYWRKITFDGLVRIIPPKRSAVPLFGRHVEVSPNSHMGTRLQNPVTGPQIWGLLLTKYHIWRIQTKKRKTLSRQNEALYNFLDDMSWWAIYWAIHSHIAQSGTRLKIPATGPQIWGHLLTKYHIWRISEDYPAKTKRCTTFWTTCRGELYIELSIAI